MLLLLFSYSSLSISRYPRKYSSSILDVKTDTCEMCTSIVEYIEILLNNSLVESEIAALVALTCQTLPFPISTGCSFLVTHYVPLIIQFIESGVEYLDICNKIGFCSTQSGNIVNKRRLESTRYFSEKTRKYMCHYAVSYLKGQTQEEPPNFNHSIDQICTSFPHPLNYSCKSSLKTFIPLIMKWIEAGYDEEEICSKLKY